MPTDTIVVDVLVIRELELGWLCELNGRPMFLGRLQLPPNVRMPPERKRRSVAFPLGVACNLGLFARRSA